MSQKSPEQPHLVLLWGGLYQTFSEVLSNCKLASEMHVSYLLLTETVTEKHCFCSTTHASQNQNHIIVQLLKQTSGLIAQLSVYLLYFISRS